MSTKEVMVTGGIIKLILLCAFVIMMGYLLFMAIYPGIKSNNEKRAKEGYVVKFMISNGDGSEICNAVTVVMEKY